MLNPLLQFRHVVKDYGGLRPLRMEDLSVAAGEIVVVEGPDETASAVLVDLATGTALPDEGEVMVAGTATSALANHDEWLLFLEHFGIVNPRVVLLDEFSVLQNLAVPLTLDLDPLPESTRSRALSLASAVGLAPDLLEARVAAVSPLARFQVRLGRAIAHHPQLLLLEHPTLGIPASDVRACANALRRAAAEGDTAVLVLTGDSGLAGRIATRRLSWTPATGRISPRGGWPRLFRLG